MKITNYLAALQAPPPAYIPQRASPRWAKVQRRLSSGVVDAAVKTVVM
jgi:hypothetical protein